MLRQNFDSNLGLDVKLATLFNFLLILRGIAQSGSALALGARGRKFESYYPDQIIAPSSNGKTTDFESVNVGSTPAGVAKISLYG